MTTTPTSGAADLPEALRLADWMQNAVATYPQMSEDEPGGYCQEIDQVMDQAAAELRRLHNESVEVHAGYRTEQYWQGWNAALAAGQAVVPAGPWSLGHIDGNWRDIDRQGHGGVMRIVWRMEGQERTPKCEALAHAVIAALNGDAAPAQPVAEQGVAYAALPDEGEPWRGHKFKEVQRGCWRCDCGKTIKEATSDQSTPASGGNYPVMPKRYTVDDDGEELFTAEKMRAFADATHALRASHGQAPAGATEPTEQQILEAAEKAGLWPNTVHSWIPAFHRYHKELAKAKSAQAQADSVQEDAARYRLVRRGQHWSVIDGIGNDLRAESLDAAVDAARKQGANHDR